ncbi:MAG: DUF5655 domain-containing protein [Acidimicrobiia bacterium]
MATQTVDEFFEGKPKSRAIFETVAARIERQGPSTVEVKSQISFAVNRKFAWFWLYNVTQQNPSGVLHVQLALHHRVDEPRVRDISQTGRNRWNHQVVIRTLDDARSVWLGDLLEQAYAYGGG